MVVKKPYTKKSIERWIKILRWLGYLSLGLAGAGYLCALYIKSSLLLYIMVLWVDALIIFQLVYGACKIWFQHNPESLVRFLNETSK